MSMTLNENQSALILEIDEAGEVSINIASGDHDGLTAKLCQAIAMKLQEEEFQAELLGMIEE